MKQGRLEIETVRLSERATIMNLRGELTGAAEGPLMEACEQARGEGIVSLILNFADMHHMNSLGASALVKLHVQSRRLGQQLLYIGLANGYREVFMLTGLDRVISRYEGEAEALATARSLAREQPPLAGQREGLSESGRNDRSRVVAHWAAYAPKLKVQAMPPEAVNLNVEGRRAVGPIEGFGALWEKTYRITLSGVDIKPVEVIEVLKETFPELQPRENRFYPSPSGIRPGEIVLINASTPGGPVNTGVLVAYADDESFTLMTPQGHPESGWVTFSAATNNGATVCQIQGLARASDPVYEIALRLVGAKVQERIWTHVLASLAHRLGADAHVQVDKVCLDAGLQWRQVGNIWYNAQLRTLAYVALIPLRRLGSLFRW